MKLQPGTDKKTQGHVYNPGKLPSGAPGPAAVIPVLKQAPKPFQDRQGVSPITAPPRAGGIMGGLYQQAAKQKAMAQQQLPQVKPGATGPGGGPPVAQLPPQMATPWQQQDPAKQAAAQKFASHGAAGGGTTPFFGTGGGVGQDPYAAKGIGAGKPGMGGMGTPGTGGLPGQGGNPASYGAGTNPLGGVAGPNPNLVGGTIGPGAQGLPGVPVTPNLGPNIGDAPPSTQPTMPWQQPVDPTSKAEPGYTKDPYPGPTDMGGLTPNTKGDADSTWQDEFAAAEAEKKANEWKGGDAADWFDKYMKGSIQGDKFGPGDEWVKQQGDSIALDAEKQAAADKMKSQSQYAAAGLGGSGMGIGGMGQIDSAKNAAVTSAKADLAGQNAKLAIQDKIAQLNTQMAMAKQKGDVALQEKLATQLLDFQKQQSLWDQLYNAPEKMLEYLGQDKFADQQSYESFMNALAKALETGDPSALAAVMGSLHFNTHGATYGDSLPNTEGNITLPGGAQPDWYTGMKPWDSYTPAEQQQIIQQHGESVGKGTPGQSYPKPNWYGKSEAVPWESMTPEEQKALIAEHDKKSLGAK